MPPCSPVVDLEKIKTIMGDDQALIQECFSDYLLEWPEMFADIRSAVETRSYDRLDRSSHRLKGALTYLGAAPAAAAAEALEAAGRCRQAHDLVEQLARLHQECGKVAVFIQEFRTPDS